MENMKRGFSRLFCAVMMSLVFCAFLFAGCSVFAQDDTGTSGGGWVDTDSTGTCWQGESPCRIRVVYTHVEPYVR